MNMKTRNKQFWLMAVILGLSTTAAVAEPTGWLSKEPFKVANWNFVQKWMVPADIGIRANDDQIEYFAEWQENRGTHFGFQLIPIEGREEADSMIKEFAEAQDLIAGMPRLCLAKYSHLAHGGTDHYLLYLVTPDMGIRCISLPPA